MGGIAGSLDLGGTTTSCAIATADGSILAEKIIPTRSSEGPDAVLRRIGDALEEVAAEAREQPEAIGMGVPGLVDLARGATLFLPNLPTQWRGVPVAEVLGSRFGCPVFLLNDVRTAALGELTFGAGKDTRTFVFFALGTGVGGGVVVDGKLRLGPLGAAGELGHQTILPDGPLCGCGNRGCLETLASGPALVGEGVRLMRSGMAPKLHELVAGDAGAVTPKEISAAAEAGDEALRAAIERMAGYLGVGVANIVTALHPELVVLGGGVAAVGGLLEGVRAEVLRRVRMFPAGDVRIERSLLGDKAGLFGGIALARNRGA